jgi:hypothetical protein
MLDSAGVLNDIFIALGFRRNGLARAKPKNCKPKSEVHVTLYSSTRLCDGCCEEAQGESAGAREEVGERECQRGTSDIQERDRVCERKSRSESECAGERGTKFEAREQLSLKISITVYNCFVR